MTDKEKIIEYIDKLLEKYPKNYYLLMVAEFIDSMQEEPVSEELIKELKDIVNIRDCVMQGVPVIKIARHFVKWQKEQMMSNAIDVEVKVDAGGYPYIPQMELYDYDKDVPLAKEGDKYNVVLIKEDL